MVKFGHQLVDGIRSLGSEFNHDALHYKEFKKLLKFAAGEDEVEIARDMPVVEAAKQCITSPFWSWPQDAEGIEETSRLEWVDRVFERKLISEAKRLQVCMVQMTSELQRKEDLLGQIQAGMKESASEEDVRRRVQLQTAINDQAHQIRMYAMLNYTGFFKILKKYDKMYRRNGLPARMQHVMPHIDKMLNPDSWRNEESIDRSMQRLDEAFGNLRALLSQTPEKAQVLTNLHNSQVELCEELLLHNETMSVESDEKAYGETMQARVLQMFTSGQFTPPLVSAITDTKYDLQCFVNDLIAASIISIAGIPKAMAYATLAGVPIDSGISTLYVPCLVYALIGSSRQVAISPQSVTCLLLAQIVDETLRGTVLEEDIRERIQLTMMYTLTTGAAILLFGLMKLGFLLNFISRPVLSGFVSASALIAVASTFKSLMRLQVKKSPILYVLVTRIVQQLPEAHWQTSLVSFAGILFMLTMNVLSKRWAPVLKKRDGKLAATVVKILKVPSVIYLVLGGVLLGSGLCSFIPFSPWALKHTVVGRGASFPALFYGLVASRQNCEFFPDGVQHEYTASGSGDGLGSVLTNGSIHVDFAGSDIKPSSQDLLAHGVKAFPVVKSMLCPIVNIPLLDGSTQINLILDTPTVAAIFNGEVTRWRDERIQKLNPNLPWHLVGEDRPILVVVRSDSSGTTQAFSQSLLTCEGCDATAFSAGLKVNWRAPKQVFAKGMNGMVEGVGSSPWSIGYASFSAVMQSKGQSAVCTALSTPEGVTTPVVAWTNPTLVTWPLWHTSYLLVPPAESVQGRSDSPRLDPCAARGWLHKFIDELYGHSKTARDHHFELLPRPEDLDALSCGKPARRLADEQKSGTCKKPKATCSDLKMVGYIKPSFIKVELPQPMTSVPLSKVLINSMLLACIALLEHVANVKLYADRVGYKVSTSSDLVAVGLCNIFGCLSGSFVVAGGFSRSALNAKASSQISMLLSVFVSLATVYAAAPLLSMLPDAILSVILFMAVIGLVEWKMLLQLARLRKGGMVDVLALVIAFFATCFLGVVQGMASAIGFSLVVFVFNSSYPQIVELDRSPGTMYYSPVENTIAQNSCMRGPRCSQPSDNVSMPKSRIKVLRFEAPLWFANSSRFLDRMLGEIKQDSKAIIIDMSTVPWVDFSAGIAIKEVVNRASDNDVILRFAHVNAQVMSMIQSLAKVDDSAFFATNFDARMSIGDPRTNASSSSSPWAPDGTSMSREDPSKLSAVTLEVIDPDSGDSDENGVQLGSDREEFPATPASDSAPALVGRPRQRTSSSASHVDLER